MGMRRWTALEGRRGRGALVHNIMVYVYIRSGFYVATQLPSSSSSLITISCTSHLKREA